MDKIGIRIGPSIPKMDGIHGDIRIDKIEIPRVVFKLQLYNQKI